jgi:hypothetical protein
MILSSSSSSQRARGFGPGRNGSSSLVFGRKTPKHDRDRRGPPGRTALPAPGGNQSIPGPGKGTSARPSGYPAPSSLMAPWHTTPDPKMAGRNPLPSRRQPAGPKKQGLRKAARLTSRCRGLDDIASPAAKSFSVMAPGPPVSVRGCPSFLEEPRY